MTTTQEALKMAIKTCEFWIGGGDDELKKTIQACKEALEQPMINGLTESETNQTMSVKGLSEQPEPIMFLDLSNSNGNHPVEQPAQEPVAWMNEDELPDSYPYDEMFKYSEIVYGVRMFPVFQPAPSWQGLSDDEIANLIRNKLLDKEQITIEDLLDLLLEQQNILERKNK